MYTYYMYECVYTTTKRILCVHTYLQVSTIVQHGCVGPMCNLIPDRWPRDVIAEIIFNGLENCLKHVEIAFKIFEESGAIDKIKELQDSNYGSISDAAATLLKVYFRGYVSIEFSHVEYHTIKFLCSMALQVYSLLFFFMSLAYQGFHILSKEKENRICIILLSA